MFLEHDASGVNDFLVQVGALQETIISCANSVAELLFGVQAGVESGLCISVRDRVISMG